MSRNTSKPVQMPGGSTDSTTPTDKPADLEKAQLAQGAAAPKPNDDNGGTDSNVELDALRAELAAAKQAQADAERAKAQAEAEAAALRKDSKSKQAQAEPSNSRTYRDTPAADINPATLSAPVLSRDGWVVPPPPTTTDLRRL